MLLQRWDPTYELRRMNNAMNRRWRGFDFESNGTEHKQWPIPVDVVEEEGHISFCASLPGVNPEKIDVSIDDRVLSIKAETSKDQDRKQSGYLMRERRFGSFHRAFRLPDTVDTDKAGTSYENGLLTVTLPKAETKKAKRLEITVGKAQKSESE
jgi:HSP20 family protein